MVQRAGAHFLNDWAGLDQAVLERQFGLPAGSLSGLQIILASYSRDPLGGEAFVLFRQDGVLYEVNASHDSGSDLAGQWEPEETLVRVLRHRLTRGRLGLDDLGENLFAEELAFDLGWLEAEGQS